MTFELAPRSLWTMPSPVDFLRDTEEWFNRSWGQSGLTVKDDTKSKKWLIEANVAGLKPGEVNVTFEEGTLTIKGESKEEKKDELQHRSYYYSMTMPQDIDMAVEPEATYNHGIMTVAFAKSGKPQAKQIPVKSIEK